VNSGCYTPSLIAARVACVAFGSACLPWWVAEWSDCHGAQCCAPSADGRRNEIGSVDRGSAPEVCVVYPGGCLGGRDRRRAHSVGPPRERITRARDGKVGFEQLKQAARTQTPRSRRRWRCYPDLNIRRHMPARVGQPGAAQIAPGHVILAGWSRMKSQPLARRAIRSRSSPLGGKAQS